MRAADHTIETHACSFPSSRRTRKSTSPSASRCPSGISACPTRRWIARIAAAKAALGRRLVILGHHYQRDEVIKFADYTGDSFKLAGQVSQAPRRRLHRLLRRALHGGERRRAERRRTSRSSCRISPPAARWPTWPTPDQLEMCWDDLEQMGIGSVGASCPVTYINSAAAIKAFCGEHGGIVCTSSNAAATLRWAWERGERILFLPDQHLGRNTAYKMGVPLDQMVVWDPNEIWGGLEADAVEARADDSVEGPLLRARALHRAADREHPRAASRRARHRASRGAARRRSGRRRLRVDRIHHQAGEEQPGRIRLGRRHRNPPRQPAGAAGGSPTGPCCRSISSAACARRCSASRRIICCGSSRPGRRRGPQPHRRSRRPETLDPGRARPDAVAFVD